MGSSRPTEWPAPPLSRTSATHDGLSFAKIGRAIYRHKWMIAGLVLFVTLITYFVVGKVQPQYQAEAVLMIEPRKSQITDSQSLAPSTVDAGTIRTEAEVLRSLGLAKSVADSLDLQRNIAFLRAPGLFASVSEIMSSALDRAGLSGAPSETKPASPKPPDLQDVTVSLRDRITVSNDGRSSIIKVRFESVDAELAARIVNTYLRTYIAEQLDAKSAAITNAAQLLGERADELREKVAASDRAVQIFRDENRLTEARGVTVIGQQLAELNSQFVLATAERIRKETHLQQLQTVGGSSTPDILSSPMILRLKEQEADLLRQEAEIKSSLGAAFPSVRAIEAKRAEAQENIVREFQKIVLAVSQDVDAARSHEIALKKALNDLETRAHELDKAQVHLRQLEREANADHDLYQHFLKRAKETGAQKYLQEADARVISEALIPKVPTFPKTSRIMGLAAVVSMLCALGIAILLERFDHTFVSGDELEREADVLSLGLIPEVRAARGGARAVIENPPALFAEAIRWVRTSLELGPSSRPKVIVVTSSQANEGKTTISISIARSSAQSGQKTLLIDCDLRMGSLGRLLSKTDKPGIETLLETQCDVQNAINNDSATGLDYILATSGEVNNPQALLGSERMARLLTHLRGMYDFIVIDAPPVLPVSDARVLARIADATILVVRWNVTPRSCVLKALRELRTIGANVAGFVLNRANLRKGGMHYDGVERLYGHDMISQTVEPLRPRS